MATRYGLQFYEKQEDILDLSLLERDAIPFAVLMGIVNRRSEKVFTDHRQLIICHSAPPWPVWVWFGPQADDKAFQAAAECLKNEFPAERGYCYNLTHEALKRLQETSPSLRLLPVNMNLLSYRCDRLLDIGRPAEGGFRQAAMADLPLIARWYWEFVREAQRRSESLEQSEQAARRRIEAGEVFLWENARQEPACMAARGDDGAFSKVAMVYTPLPERRKGFALHLVHRITEGILAEGKIPVLYTDADYGASNACYQKIGYRQVGQLCTAGFAKED